MESCSSASTRIAIWSAAPCAAALPGAQHPRPSWMRAARRWRGERTGATLEADCGAWSVRPRGALRRRGPGPQLAQLGKNRRGKAALYSRARGVNLGGTGLLAASANPLVHGHRRPDAHGDLTDSFRPQLKSPILNEGRVVQTAFKEVQMLTKSPAALLRSRDGPAGARSRETRQDVRARSVAVPRAHLGGDTDALDWRSDPHLLAILARGVKREREAREKDRLPWRRDELDQPARRADARPHRPARTPAGAA